MLKFKKNDAFVSSGLLILAAAFWGSAYPVRKIGLEFMDPFFFNSFRFFLAFILMFSVYLTDKKLKKRVHVNEIPEPAPGVTLKSIRFQIVGGVLAGLCYCLASSF